MNAGEFLSIIINLISGLFELIIQIFKAIYFLVTDVFIGGFIFFIFHIFESVSLIFIIIEMFIVIFSLINSRDEMTGKKSPFRIMQNYVSYHVFFIVGMGKLLTWIINLLYNIVNTIIPV